ncbi:UNVERIFIED_CONTAM: hypothetical protein FKN15_026495 [Acipenser sinensis]
MLDHPGIVHQGDSIRLPASFPLVVRGYRKWFPADTGKGRSMQRGTFRKVPVCLDEDQSEQQQGKPSDTLEGHLGKKRVDSAPRESSPVPSYYSEPTALTRRSLMKGVTRPQAARDAEEDDDVRSLKSVRSVRSTSQVTGSVKRYRGFTRRWDNKPQLPPIALESGSQGGTLIVTGATCPKYSALPPIYKAKSSSNRGLERPPSRSGCRTQWDGLETEQDPWSISHTEPPADRRSEKVKSLESVPQARITFHNPVVQDVFPIIPDSDRAHRVNKLQRTKSSSSVASTSSLASLTSRGSGQSVGGCTGRSVAKESRKNPSQPRGKDLVDTLWENSKNLTTEAGITFPKIESHLRGRNRKPPVKSVLKKSFDWKADSQIRRETPGRSGLSAEFVLLNADSFLNEQRFSQTATSCAYSVTTPFPVYLNEQRFETGSRPVQPNTLLEPFSGPHDYLRRQLLHSPGVYRGRQAPALTVEAMADAIPAPGANGSFNPCVQTPPGAAAASGICAVEKPSARPHGSAGKLS